MLPRYWVFGGANYYPSGGIEDLRAKFDSREEAVAYALGFCAADSRTWAHVGDMTTGEIVWRTAP